MNKKEQSKLYNKLYKAGQALFDHHDPCKFVDGGCHRQRIKNYSNRTYEKTGCCSRCKHLTKKGCKVKSLCCKLWFCYQGTNKYRLLNNSLSFLRNIQLKAGLSYGICKSKKDAMKSWT